MYSMWKTISFFLFKPHEHIAFHQIMFFLAMSYYPFNSIYVILNVFILKIYVK